VVQVDEIWRSIRSYEGLYEVSNTGLVRSIKRDIILKPGVATSGHLLVNLYRGITNMSTKYIHILVAEVFVDNDEGKPEVNHKDCNKLNNHYTNLEWVTSSENMLHMYSNNRSSRAKQVMQYSLDGALLSTFHSTKEAARLTGISANNIATAARGATNTAGGYMWEYAITN
jgi:hypothetical protein